MRSAEARLRRDIAVGVLHTEPVREVIRETRVETRFVTAPPDHVEPLAPITVRQLLDHLEELA